MKRIQLYKISLRIVGVLFIVSGLGKSVDFLSFVNTISDYSLVETEWILRLTASGICFVEILIGFQLVLLYKARRNVILILILTISFTIIYTYGSIFLNINNCDCFGKFTTPLINNKVFLYTRNILIILVCSVSLNYQLPDHESMSIYINTIYILAIALAFFLGNISGISFVKSNSIEKTSFNTEIIEDLKLSADSSYFVLIFSYSCPYCVNSIENVKQYSQANYIDRVIFIATMKDSNDRSKIDFYKAFQIDNNISEYKYSYVSRYTKIFPTGLYIVNSEIKEVIYGLMPAELLLRKKLGIKV